MGKKIIAFVMTLFMLGILVFNTGLNARASTEDIYVQLDDKSISYGAWLDDGSGMDHKIIYEGGIISGTKNTGYLDNYVNKGLARFTMYVDFNLSEYLYGKIANAESVSFDITPMQYDNEAWNDYAVIAGGGNASTTVFENPRGEMLMGVWFNQLNNTLEPTLEQFGNVAVVSYSNRQTRFGNYQYSTTNLNGLDLTQIRFYMSLWVDDILKPYTYVYYRLNGIKIKVTITYEDGSIFQENYIANTLGSISSGIHDINDNLNDISGNQQTIINQNQTIINQGDTIINPDPGDQEKADNMQSNVSNRQEQSDQLIEDIKVDKPTITDELLNPVDKVDDESLNTMGGVLGAVFVSPTLGSIAVMALVFGLIGYILYGKR